MLCASLTVHCI